MVTAVMDLLKEFGVTVEDLRRVVFHQANGRLLAAVLDGLGIAPDQMYSVLERYGNASSASRPIALDHAVREGQVASGDLILLGTFGGRYHVGRRPRPLVTFRRSSRVCSA